MLKPLTIVLAFLMTLSVPLSAQDFNKSVGEIYKNHILTDRGLQELWDAYGFLTGQQYSIDKFRQVSPDRTETITSAFNEAFPSLLEKLTVALNSAYTEKKVLIEREILIENIKNNPSMNFSIKEENFIAFETEMSARASGKVPAIQKHLPTFLSVIFKSNSAAELEAGYQKLYSSQNDKKSLGLNLEITTPLSWWNGAATGAHLLQKWKPMNGALNEIYMVAVEELPSDFSNNPLKVFTQGGLEQTFLNGGKLHSRYLNNSFEKTVLSYQGTINNAKMNGLPQFVSQVHHWNIMIHGNKMLTVMCKKIFEKLTAKSINLHLDDLKNECDLLTRNIKVKI